ncbi:hypothetical protein SEA_NHAGOS_48 [Gordonia phage NHagos]|nr:hypothetical protein SEA_NHAGOS_48 [Gordonia phage NHagos]
MALTFSRAALIEAAEAAVQEDTDKQTRWDADAQRMIDADKTEWMKLGPARVRKLRDYLTAQLKTGKPINRYAVRKVVGEHDVENIFHVELSDYEIRRELNSRPALDTTEYIALIDMLRASTGDEISASQLRSVGFGNLNPLFKQVAKAKQAAAVDNTE